MRYFWGIIAIVLGMFLYASQKIPYDQHQYFWHINSDRSRVKTDDEYDVIIVGGGFGGLSCAALLSKHGYKVLVLERNQQVGGFCSSYETKGFRFTYGAEDIGGLWERGPLRFLLQELGMQSSQLFVLNDRRLLNDAVSVTFKPGQFEQALIEAFPEEKRSIHRFLRRAKKVYLEAFDAEMIQKWGVMIPQELVPELMSQEWQEDYALSHKHLVSWSNKSYQEVLDSFFTNSELKKALSAFLGYFGAFPFNTPASLVVTHTFGYFFFGGYHALYTPQHFAELLAAYIEDHGGAVFRQHGVDEIVVADRAVEGVRVGKKYFKAPIVVSNVNAKRTYFDLVKKEHLSEEFLSYIISLPFSPSSFSLHIGLDRLLPSYPALIQDIDNKTYISLPSQKDPNLSLAGMSTLVIREPARYQDFIGRTAAQYNHYVQGRKQLLLEKLKKYIPEVEGHIIFTHVITPNMFEGLVDMPLGAIYGYDRSRVRHYPYFKSPLPGLYLSNASSGGPGVESVVRTGILCAHDIMGWKSS